MKTTYFFVISFFLLYILPIIGLCQAFKYLNPHLTDSTKVIKFEIDTLGPFERIYYIDYSRNSPEKAYLADFGSNNWDMMEPPEVSYSRIVNNLKQKPEKVNLRLPGNWVNIYKYKGDWILYYDYVSKYILTDSSLITFYMDGPLSSVISEYKTIGNRHDFNMFEYYWENDIANPKSELQIKIIDPSYLISIWKFINDEEVSYQLMIPADKAKVFPIMVIESSDLMDDETEIFDKVDLEKLWMENSE